MEKLGVQIGSINTTINQLSLKAATEEKCKEKAGTKNDEGSKNTAPLLPMPNGFKKSSLEGEGSNSWKERMNKGAWPNNPRVELNQFEGEKPKE